VHNRAVDTFRRELSSARRDVSDDGIADALPARERTEDEVERRSDALLVRTALDGLPPDQRQVIELAYFGGYSQSQIAEALGLPPGTVKGRMRLALRKLRIALGEPAGVAP
jgi:RNA polymerase sigma-70 factor (ECF subfamily)